MVKRLYGGFKEGRHMGLPLRKYSHYPLFFEELYENEKILLINTIILQ